MPMMSSTRKKNLYPLPTKKIMDAFFFAKVDGKDRRGVFSIVREPAQAKIRYWDTVYTIGIPWHLFSTSLKFGSGIIMIKSSIWFLDGKPSSLDEAVYSCSLPNVSGSGYICYGSVRPYRKLSIIKYVNSLYHRFWQTKFNHDIWPSNTPWNIIVPETLLSRWQEATKNGEKIHWKRSYVREIKGALGAIGGTLQT